MPILAATILVGHVICPTYVYALALAYADQYQLPAWLVLGLAHAESGCEPAATNLTPTESSYGLLMLNTQGGQGTGHTPRDLLDPAVNFQLGLPPVQAAAAAATARQLSGLPWVEAVLASSGHNRSDGHVTHDVTLLARRVLDAVFNPDGSFARYPAPY